MCENSVQTLCVISKIGLRIFLDVWMETYLIVKNHLRYAKMTLTAKRTLYHVSTGNIYLQSLFRNCIDTFKRKLIIFIIDKLMLKDYYL